MTTSRATPSQPKPRQWKTKIVMPTEYNQTPINWILIWCSLFTSHSIRMLSSFSAVLFFNSSWLNVDVWCVCDVCACAPFHTKVLYIFIVQFFFSFFSSSPSSSFIFLLHPACVRCVGRAHNNAVHQFCLFSHFISFCCCCYCLFCFMIMIIIFFKTIKMESTLGLPQNGVP